MPVVSRYRLAPTPAQIAELLEHSRYVWNLGP
ncbi:helix-turn-helix domain-containing protein [Kribbella soli]